MLLMAKITPTRTLKKKIRQTPFFRYLSPKTCVPFFELHYLFFRDRPYAVELLERVLTINCFIWNTFCLFVDCFSPPYMPNAVVLEGHRLDDGGRTDYRNGESITMTCRPGFFDRERKYSTVVCVGNQWRHEKFECEGKLNGRSFEKPLG